MNSTETKDRWTDERLDRLKALWTEGASLSEIARDLGAGITRSAVVGKVRRLGLPRRQQSGAQALSAERKINGKKRQGKPFKVNFKAMPEDRNAPTPPILPVEDDLPDVTHMCGLMDLDNHTCRWPVSGDGSAMQFCGVEPEEGSPYCEHHSKYAFNKERHA